MTDHNSSPTHQPDEDLLLSMALGEVSPQQEVEATTHIMSCTICSLAYEELLAGVTIVLESAPDHQPSKGASDEAVAALLTAQQGSARPVPDRPAQKPRHRLALAAAAGLILGGALGGSAGSLISSEPDEALVNAEERTLLTGPEGEQVGSVLPTYGYAGDMYLVEITDAEIAGTIDCWVVLSDGSEHHAGQWALYSEGGSWVVDAPEADEAVEMVRLVDEDGHTWSASDF